MQVEKGRAWMRCHGGRGIFDANEDEEISTESTELAV